ncbi:MAG: nitronate monooxygenase [Proteobacteria bacterium]|jgi:nitronate monooxygenase|nr:nitronate monooxygenase [Pseudomonadota bacterium]
MLTTALTRLFDLTHPIVLGPMGGVSGGMLTAAVSNAGGLGLVGGGYGDPEWLGRELSLAREQANRPWGCGLITWAIKPEVLDLALSFEPAAFMLSFGDPRAHVDAIRRAGCKLICQVQGLDEARLAVEAGADLIVAQGTEAGGHGGQRSTLPLVPAVVDLVAPIPVVAAGGIADGRGLAAALALGACGALIGTRFYAARESLGHDAAKARIVAADGGDTRRTRVFDVVRDYSWPKPYTGRALRNDFMARWDGREDALAASLSAERTAFRSAAAAGDFDTAMVWAGEAVDLIDRVDDAAALVARIARDAETCLRRAAALADGAATATSLPLAR